MRRSFWMSSRSSPSVPLVASGGEGRYHWYLDGRYLHTSPPVTTTELSSRGTHQLLVVDDAGNLDKIDITSGPTGTRVEAAHWSELRQNHDLKLLGRQPCSFW